MTTTILLVRHGQTEWNLVERFRGRFDVPLNNTGIKQAQKTAQFIKERWRPAAVYASPLGRAMQTAEEIAKSTGTYVQLAEGLLDIDYGEWQTLTPEEVRVRWPEQATSWYEHPETVQIPGGESLDQVRKRATQAIKEILWLHADHTVVLVSHTVVNRLLLLEMLKLGNERFWHIQQEPCAINVILESGDDFTVSSMNCTAHLAI